MANNNTVNGGMLPGLPGGSPLNNHSKPPVTRDSPNFWVTEVSLSAPLKDLERGAIILPDSDVKPSPSGGGVYGTFTKFNPDSVRSWILLFDRFDYPANPFEAMGDSCPPGLESWENFQRTYVGMQGMQRSDVHEIMLEHSFNALDNRERGRWALARGPQSRGFSSNMLTPLAAFQLKLHEALPVPAAEVPYDDVHIFKARRKDELIALRHYLDDLALEVSRNGFDGFAETVAFEKFQVALADHVKVSREANFAKRILSLDVTFNWKELLTNKSLQTAVATGVAGASFGMPLVTAAWGAVTAAVSLETAAGLKRGGKTGSPFEYIVRAGKDLPNY